MGKSTHVFGGIRLFCLVFSFFFSFFFLCLFFFLSLFFFFVLLSSFLRSGLLCCDIVPGTLAFHLLYLDKVRLFGLLCFTVCDHIIFISPG